jgi:N-acetylmuramoyl-L-alanine amidase
VLQQISIYLLKVICISGLLFLYYQIALRNKQFHYYNRFYLLLTFGVSITLPFLQLEWFTFWSGSPQTIHLYKIIYGKGEEDIAVNGPSFFNAEQMLLFFLALLSVCLLIFFSTRIIRIYRLKKKYPLQQLPEFDFVNTDISAAPFSFLKNIFWRNDISLEEETGKQILQHEITHIRQKHSWDKLYVQFLLCFYWLNPFFHLMKKELYLIHEFIADEQAVKHTDADAFAKMLLTAQFGKFNFLPAQSIFYSSIKRRLVMLTTSKKSQFSYVRRLMVLPLIASLVCLFAFTIKTRNSAHSPEKTMTVKPFVLVVDAGHGGKDFGALGNGLYEKDIVLKLAQKVKSLSSEYGITVILTRNSDVFMSPTEKSYFSNGQNADALISIHANADYKNSQANSGMEVYISQDNTQESSSILLGSAILQSLQPGFKTPDALNTRNAGIWILKNSIPPAALIECGYITNTDDAAILKNDGKIELIAKNILQGVALYANNKNSISPNIIDNKDTIPSGKSTASSSKTPLYVLNGKIISKAEMEKLNPDYVRSVNVLKDKMATDKYGEKGKDGVVEISFKPDDENLNQPIYVIDEKVAKKSDVDTLAPSKITEINVLKDKQATDKYGEKGKNGIVEIKTKKG